MLVDAGVRCRTDGRTGNEREECVWRQGIGRREREENGARLQRRQEAESEELGEGRSVVE